ncbi:MAG: NHL repeat-containing protein [Saccharofermentanales bacterium]
MISGNKTKIYISALLTVIIAAVPVLAADAPVMADAVVPYRSYTYDSWGQPRETATGYVPEKLLTGGDIGAGSLKEPSDLFIAENGMMYILDAGNDRLVRYDPVNGGTGIMKATAVDGTGFSLAKAAGLFVTADERILIADPVSQSVVVFDSTLKEIGRLEVPKTDILPAGYFYQPVKVIEDSGGVVYVLSQGSISGAMQFDTDGSFMGFFGSEKVTLTAQLLTDHFWKSILTKEQAGGMARAVPVEFISFDIDKNDFIYTIRRGNDVSAGQVRKLNALGENILPDKLFGDTGSQQKLNDICVDSDGFITILDQGKCRLYQYDQESNLMYTFASKGEQLGCFTTPVAVASSGSRIYVLDSSSGAITVFRPTDFGDNIRKALLLYYDGKYDQAMLPWLNVQRSDHDYGLANIGLGKAYEGLGDNGKAMYHYKKGDNRTLYSSAFVKYRTEAIRKNFPVFMLLMVLTILAPVLYRIARRRRKRRTEYDVRLTRRKMPVYCALHPFVGYSEMKYARSGSMTIALMILAGFFAATILSRQLTGFIFNYARTDRFDILVHFVSTAGLFLTFVLTNWLVTTIAEGKGKLKEIFIFCSYVLLPFTILTLAGVVFSNILGIEEMMFMRIFQFILYAMTGMYLVIALMEGQMYSLKKTIYTILLTGAGILVIVLIGAIVYSIFTQIVSFAGTLITELTLR